MATIRFCDKCRDELPPVSRLHERLVVTTNRLLSTDAQKSYDLCEKHWLDLNHWIKTRDA